MSFRSSVMGLVGFGLGASAGTVVGYFLFIFFKPTDVKDPTIRLLVEHDTKSLEQILPEIPLWVKNPDFHRIDWLNKFIENMWPYLDKAICKSAGEVIKPIIVENCAKYKIGSIEFKTLTLGSLPPTFQGMKTYVTDEHELVMETSLKWAGNPNITLVVKKFGLKATVQVIDLQIFAIPRITLKPLVPSFPCFASILVSLMEKPHVDFGLKLFGADVMSIPGLYRYVQKTIKNQIASMYLWPRTLEVPIMDPSNAMKKPVGILLVNIVRAYELKKNDLMGKSDPYVKLKLTKDRVSTKKTTVKSSNLNPEWNEEFKLVVKDPESQALEISVYDWEKVGKHDKLGMNVVTLKELIPDELRSLTLDVLKNMDPNDAQNEMSHGHLVVELTYKPFKENHEDIINNVSVVVEKAPEGTPSGGGLLVVAVHEAQDLEGQHHMNPYVRIFFRGEKKKTKHIKKNRAPRWGEEFHFLCEEPPIDDRVHLEVLSRPPSIGIHSKEALGYVQINLADVIRNERINGTFNLIGSRNGQIQVELQWRVS